MSEREDALVDALRLSGELSTMLLLALAEARECEITGQQGADGVGTLTRRARRLAGMVGERLGGL